MTDYLTLKEEKKINLLSNFVFTQVEKKDKLHLSLNEVLHSYSKYDLYLT